MYNDNFDNRLKKEYDLFLKALIGVPWPYPGLRTIPDISLPLISMDFELWSLTDPELAIALYLKIARYAEPNTYALLEAAPEFEISKPHRVARFLCSNNRALRDSLHNLVERPYIFEQKYTKDSKMIALEAITRFLMEAKPETINLSCGGQPRTMDMIKDAPAGMHIQKYHYVFADFTWQAIANFINSMKTIDPDQTQFAFTALHFYASRYITDLNNAGDTDSGSRQKIFGERSIKPSFVEPGQMS